MKSAASRDRQGHRVARQKPKRSYRAVIEALRQVWSIEAVPDAEAIWRLGTPELDAFAPERIRVAVWNLCKGAGGHLFEHDYRTLCYRSDLILTQEALLSRRSIRTFCERGFETVHAASYMRRDGLRDGVMTVARAASEEPVIRVICKYPEPLLKTPKAALMKFFRIKGHSERLLVINVHATLIRRKSAAIEEMEHLLSFVPEHRGPIIFAGDFNTFTAGYLQAIAPVLGRFGLRYVEIPNDPRPATQCLDQVFCRGLTPTNVHIDTTIRNSDHFPILANFAL